MKKLLASLTFFALFIISQVQLVHAIDMMDMNMSSGHHSHAENTVSIFCDTGTNNTKSQCAKELIPDTALREKDYIEVTPTSFSILPFFDFRNEILDGRTIILSIEDPPGNTYQRSEYVHMIGIIKSLD